MGNESLVVELDIKQEDGWSDEVSVVIVNNYTLHKENKYWNDAEAVCKSDGGQLASIHSDEEQELAKRAAEGHNVWLGGRREKGQWRWSDHSTWDFTNWDGGHREIVGSNLVMKSNGEWLDSYFGTNYFLCQGVPTAITDNGLTRIEFTKEQLEMFPYYVLFKSQVSSRRTLNTSPDKMRMPGFTLN